MGWKVVEVNTDETVQLYLNNLLIKRQKEKILINIRDIDLLIFNNDRSFVSIRLLNALTDNDTSIIFMNSKHEPASHTIATVGNHMSLKVLESQIKWKISYKGNIWKRIVINKIRMQSNLLKRLNINTQEMFFRDLISNVNPFDSSNREGHAAKVYWHQLFGDGFKREQKIVTSKFAVINSMLNYGYAILRSLTIKAIIYSGLDTRISLFHKSFSNFFALSSDLMEPFRPMVDEIVYKHRFSSNFGFDVRDELIGIFEKKVLIENKRHYLSNALKMYANKLAKGEMLEWIELWD